MILIIIVVEDVAELATARARNIEQIVELRIGCQQRVIDEEVGNRVFDTDCQASSSVQSLNLHRIRWLGHVLRMAASRLPHRPLFVDAAADWCKVRGGKVMTWRMELKSFTKGLATVDRDDIYSHNINIEKPRYDQSTYSGRAKHFFITTNPLNILKGSSELEAAKTIVQKYRSTPAVVFWQWFNQTYNAAVNYTNRSGDSPISVTRLSTSYVLATTGAVATALVINKQVQRFPPLIGRFVPFLAVAAANCINIPCMRSLELSEGTTITDEHGETLGKSTVVGRRAIFKVVVSRILMAMPGMLLPPFLMNSLEKRGTLARYPWLGAPLQVTLCGVM
ncbi:uncharacterized protein DEA37_0014244 [Paragonimus westermani]|uniref:Uncharacterized protein n=1 Tax=Paragonimus westermani TaxID=34504 RepID=A0A5J4NNL1_9TREM|nr:uncharacterized protein DEA37_0014244 [Paragonimus westermani]